MRTILSALLMLVMSQIKAADSIVINLGATDTTFQVALPSNPSTGYQWTIKGYDKQLLTLVSSKYISPKTNLIGAGGVMEYNFELNSGVKVPKRTALVFLYARPSENVPEQESIKTVTINFLEK